MQILGLTLGNWRFHSTDSSGMLRNLNHRGLPGLYVFSARACGLKGALPGARHTWISAFDGARWTTVEISDEETLFHQRTSNGEQTKWKYYGTPSKENFYRSPFRSDRAPDGRWFGQAPRLELRFPGRQGVCDFLDRLDNYCDEYRFKNVFGLLKHNCSGFVSYLLWRSGLLETGIAPRLIRLRMIGFKDSAYWQSVYPAGRPMARAGSRLSVAA